MEPAIILIAIIVIAVLAFRFVSGVVKHIISLALFIIGVALIYHWLTGGDVFGIAGYVTGLVP